MPAYIYAVPAGERFDIHPIKARKPRANAKGTPKAKAPVKYEPSAEADRYLVDDATLARWTAESDADARRAILATLTPGSSSSSAIQPSAEPSADAESAWTLTLRRYATVSQTLTQAAYDALTGAEGEPDPTPVRPFDVSVREAADGFVVIVKPSAPGATAESADIASLFELPDADPAPDAEPTPDADATDGADAEPEPRRKRG